MKNGYGQEVRWVLKEDWFAHAKETMSPEKYAEIEARYKRLLEEQKELVERYKPRALVGGATFTSRAVIPAEMITDPRTGQPRVFTQEEKANYELTNRGWSPENREHVASYECQICNRLFREHSAQEFKDCMARITAPTHRLFPKGKRAKKEDVAHCKCRICSRTFRDHSQQEYDACINQTMKRHKPKQQDLVYVKCEICGRQFGNHSSQEFDACLDQIIENSV